MSVNLIHARPSRRDRKPTPKRAIEPERDKKNDGRCESLRLKLQPDTRAKPESADPKPEEIREKEIETLRLRCNSNLDLEHLISPIKI